MNKDDNIRSAVEKYGDMLYRICLVMLKSTADAEDAVQDTFMKLFTNSPGVSGEEHKKAWLIRVATNRCRDMLRLRGRTAPLDDEIINTFAADEEDLHLFELLTELPEKIRLVLTLHYIEGYKVDEIAEMIGKSPSAVKMRLSKGRRLLDEKYRKEFMNNEYVETKALGR